MRFGVVHGCIGLLAGVGCGLLTPFPGSGDPASILADSTGPDGGSPIQCSDGNTCPETQDSPLVDAATDSSIALTSNEETLIAFPGEAFTIDLAYIAPNMNVVGGGIKFPGSDEIQWTFIDGLENTNQGDILFGYVVESNVCDQVPPLCHEILTEQFAVARNPGGGDIDGDGEDDGDFVVSKAVEVPVILKCASCDSPSCLEIDALAGECQSCSQPEQCQEVFNLCFAEGKPKFDTDEADNFELFFGRDGLAWKSGTVCLKPESGPTPAEDLCQSVLDDLAVECMMLDTDTDGDTMGGTG